MGKKEHTAESIKDAIDSIHESSDLSGMFTTRQLIDSSDHGADWCNNMLRQAIELGLCEYCGDLPTKNRVGRINRVPHYRFMGEKGKKKK
jgi:hypothetical protein